MLYMNEEELSNVIEANGIWLIALSSRKWAMRYFSDETRTATLKMLFAKSLLYLCGHAEGPTLVADCTASTALEKAIRDLFRLKKHCARQHDGGFRVTLPFFDSDMKWEVSCQPEGWKANYVKMNRNHIVYVCQNRCWKYWSWNTISVVLVFNRWTLQLLNAMTLHGSIGSVLLTNSDDANLLQPFLVLKVQQTQYLELLAWDYATTNRVQLVNSSWVLKRYYWACIIRDEKSMNLYYNVQTCYS